MRLVHPSRLPLLLGALLCGCAGAPPAPAPPPSPPVAWRMPSSGDGMVAEDWWHAFGSAELDALVERAAAGSDDIAAAVARVHQATAQARIAGAASWPEVNATVSAGRQTGGAGDITDDNGNSFAAGLLASYEVDFWGRNRALRHAAAAQFQASAHDRDTVRLTVVATAASLWMQTVALRERADIAAQNLALARQTLALVESRARSGADFPLDVAQQRSLVATQQRTVAALAQAAHDSEAALAAVLGTTPERLDLGSRSLDPLAMPAIDAGVPSSLLARRPDIARAEALLAAADANVAAARAAMLPSLTLDAGVGFASDTAHSLFDTPLYSVAAGLAAPIFNAGRLRAGRDLAVAQREELLAGYHAAIVAAFGDVDRALNALAGLAAQASAQGEALVQASRAYALAQSGYRAGAETLVTVLSAQQALFAARDEAIQLKQARLQAAVALYRALGGGWRGEAPTLSWASPWRHG